MQYVYNIIYDSIIMINFEDRQKTKILRELVTADKENSYRSIGQLAKKFDIPRSSVRGRMSEMRIRGYVESIPLPDVESCFKITEDGRTHLEKFTVKIEVQ